MSAAAKANAEGAPAEDARGGWRAAREHLDQIAVELQGVGIRDPIERLEQIAQLLYLRRLDDREPESGSRIFVGPATSRFRWSRLCTLRGTELRRVVEDALFYMSSLMSEAPAVADYFRDPVLAIEEPATLERVVDRITAIDMAHLKPDEMGRILEYLIAKTNPSGEFRTPHHVRALMVSLVDPAEGETIYDPACGTGGFLTDAVTYLLAKYSSAPREIAIYGEDWPVEGSSYQLQTWKEEGGKLYPRASLGRQIFGHDISRRMIRIAAMNLELQGIGPVNLRRTNSLTASGAGLTPEELSRKYDVILCAPSFGNAPAEPVRPDLPISSMRSEVLFVEVAMESLALGGRAAIVVPDSLLSASGSTFVELRKRLLFECELLAVISLPSAVFRPHSTVKTSILVLRRPRENERATSRVWFYDIKHDGFDLQRREQPEVNDIPDLLSLWERYRESGYRRVPGLPTGTVYGSGEAPRCWWAERAAIEKNGFEMSAGRYEPRRSAAVALAAASGFADLVAARDAVVARINAIVRRGPPSEGWLEVDRYAKLGDLVDVIQGKTPSTSEPSYWGDGLPWASPKDMKHHILRDTQDHVTLRAVEQASLAVVEPGAVVVVVRGMILTRHVPIAVNDVPLVISQDLRAFRPRPGSGVDAWYLFAYLKSVEDLLLAQTLGTAHGSRSLPQRFVLDFEVPVPSAEACARIGQLVQAYVGLVETAERTYGLIGKLLPAMLAEVFGRHRDEATGRDDRERG